MYVGTISKNVLLRCVKTKVDKGMNDMDSVSVEDVHTQKKDCVAMCWTWVPRAGNVCVKGSDL